MSDENEAATEEAAEPRSLRQDLEAEWDRMTAEAEAGEADEPAEASGEAAPAAADDEPDAPAPSPLEHWPAEWRGRFEGLPEGAKPYVLDLHKSLEQAHSRRSEALALREKRENGLAEIDAVIAPHREQLRLKGMSEAQAVERLLAAQAILERDPATGIAWLARSYGIAPPSPAALPPGDSGASRLGAIEAGQAALMEAFRQQAAGPRDAASLQAMEAKLAARVAGANGAGKARFPHFEAVRPQVAALMQSGAAESLESAYEQALWANPTLRAEALAARDATEAEKREAARKAEVAKARRAGRTVQGGSEPARPGLPAARSHREELERVWDQMVAE